jgi:hypothetical protein
MARGGKREGAGAPTRAGSVAKNHSIKFTDEEWETIKQKAEKNNLTISDYIRIKALE